MSNAKKYYTFRQTNSGGYYLFDIKRVVVEAFSLDEAIGIAERETEVYSGLGSADCDCCGPRWDYPWDEDSYDESEPEGDCLLIRLGA